jgi:telomeric repeat-binding factor 2-interacting protein 1
MGASNIPTKSTRSFYTLKEDQLLFDWVEAYGQEQTVPIQGNKIYQDLGELV